MEPLAENNTQENETMKRINDRKIRNCIHRCYKAKGGRQRDIKSGFMGALTDAKALRLFRRSLGF